MSSVWLCLYWVLLVSMQGIVQTERSDHTFECRYKSRSWCTTGLLLYEVGPALWIGSFWTSSVSKCFDNVQLVFRLAGKAGVMAIIEKLILNIMREKNKDGALKQDSFPSCINNLWKAGSEWIRTRTEIKMLNHWWPLRSVGVSGRNQQDQEPLKIPARIRSIGDCLNHTHWSSNIWAHLTPESSKYKGSWGGNVSWPQWSVWLEFVEHFFYFHIPRRNLTEGNTEEEKQEAEKSWGTEEVLLLQPNLQNLNLLALSSNELYILVVIISKTETFKGFAAKQATIQGFLFNLKLLLARMEDTKKT